MLHSSPPRTVIVVLGGGLDRGEIGFSSRFRAIAAAALHRRYGGIVILSGGHTAGREGVSEAEAMREYVTRGRRPRIPAHDVLVETVSLSTPENVANVIAMLRTMDLRDVNILLVAGRRNRLQAAEYFRAEGFAVRPYTVRQALMGFPSYTIPQKFDPKLSPRDRRRNILLRILRTIDPKGHLAAWIGRRMRE